MYRGGSYAFSLNYPNEKSLEDVVDKLVAGLFASGGFCAPPTIIPETGWLSGNPQSISLRMNSNLGPPCPGTDGSSTNVVFAERHKIYSCPVGEQGPFVGPLGERYCTRTMNQCVVSPDPVAISSGSKFYARVVDAPLLAYFNFYRSYLSEPEHVPFGLLNRPKPEIDPPVLDPRTPRADVIGWRSSYDAVIWTSSNVAGTNVVFNVDIPGIAVTSFLDAGASLTPLQSLAASLVRTLGGGFLYRGPDLKVWEFSAQGKLLSVSGLGGVRITLSYDAEGQLQSASDPFGRALTFDASHSPRVVRPDGEYFQYLTQGGVLQAVSFPPVNTVRHQRGYYYDAVLPATVTGEYDETGRRFATFRYGTDGRVQSTELHGNAGPVNRHAFDYSQSAQTHVEDPLGAVRTYRFGSYGGAKRLTGVSQPGGSGCAAASKATFYTSHGLPFLIDAFDGSRSCVFYDEARGLEVVRLAGLGPGSTCGGYNTPGVVLPPGSRKTSKEWHPDWALVKREATPGRIVTSIYHGQPDPFNGNVVANCAPASALLPDGKPIAMLCKRVEQATTDANGAAGFGAMLQGGVANRVTTWTYNQWGQALSANGPRVDVNDITTYAYYSDTVFTGEGAAAEGHFMGDLETVTDAAGRVTRYTRYNKLGQVLESVDPNGVITRHTYDLRQRLLSTTVGGQPTDYEYDEAGQLKKVTLLDQSWVGYDYDLAHRQIAVYDHKGNRIDYTLDGAGNRMGEQTRDPSGALRRQLSRSIDALGRVQQTTGRE